MSRAILAPPVYLSQQSCPCADHLGQRPPFPMPAHVTTPATLEAPALRPGLVELRLLERRLDARLAKLDARVEELLHAPSPYTDDEIGQVDVLCAAIAELAELK